MGTALPLHQSEGMLNDFNQKTMQALDALAEEHEIFEDTMTKLTHEIEEGDMLRCGCAELDKAKRTRTVHV